MNYWKRLTHAEQDEIITAALSQNIDYKQKLSFGIPASCLDPTVFNDQATFLKDAPLLRAYIQNPNHIGCHTSGDSELFFAGTQRLEKELIELLSVDLFKALPDSCDGYVASGGTESNIQAIWMYRNYFLREHGVTMNEIAIICSDHTHYSVAKAGDVLNLKLISVKTDDATKAVTTTGVSSAIENAIGEGIKCFIAISNMGTTMFGSIDDPQCYTEAFKKSNAAFKLHIDAAFGGFIYPFSAPENNINFFNPDISSITLDAHKMLQAPYGTGIFLTRKGFINFVQTEEAQYVNGSDVTLIGSRSGTNAIAVWMILQTYGPDGWLEKINKLIYRTDWCCSKLDEMKIPYFRHRNMNIITLKSSCIPENMVVKYGLVPDTHTDNPQWYKIVIMDHVELHQLRNFIDELKVMYISGIRSESGIKK